MVFDGLGYHNFVHSQPSLRDRMIFVDSLSKTYGMPGWRVGFMVGPEVVAKAVTTLNSNHITNIPEVVTAAAIAALTGPQDVPTAKNAEFQAKRDQVMAVMDAIPGLVCPRPQGAFYVFPDICCAFGKTHGDADDRQRRRLLQCAAGSQGRGLRAGLGLRRAARAAHLLHLPDARSCPRPAPLPGILRRADLSSLASRPRPTQLPNRSLTMKSPVRVAVTGAAGQIGYSLVFRIASGEMLGKDQPVILQMLELPMEKAQAALKGVMMELEDCAFPLLAGMVGTDDPMVAFKDADIALLVGARPRGPGMERKDLLLENAKIFTAQGAALNAVAKRDVKVLVVGNPANTNAYIAMKSAPDLNPRNFTAMLRLDHNRALSAAGRARPASRSADIEKPGRVGQPQPDHVSRTTASPPSTAPRSRTLVGDEDWNRDTFIPTVGKRGAAIIEARGLSSAASAANAAIDHVHDWVLGTNGEWTTMGVPSDGSYGIPKDVMYGFPVTCENGDYEIVQGLAIDDYIAHDDGQDPGRARGRARRRRAACWAERDERHQVARARAFRAALARGNAAAGDRRDQRQPRAAGASAPASARIYLSGGGVAAGSLGMPDLGINTLEDVLIDVRRITDVCELPLLVDIDTGFGPSAFNIARTVQQPDQGRRRRRATSRTRSAPSAAATVPGKEIVAAGEMVDRVKAAADARTDPDFFLIARTDAIAVEGVDAAIERAIACVEAGADGIFAEAALRPADLPALRRRGEGAGAGQHHRVRPDAAVHPRGTGVGRRGDPAVPAVGVPRHEQGRGERLQRDPPRRPPEDVRRHDADARGTVRPHRLPRFRATSSTRCSRRRNEGTRT